jgi:hypothetical protein
MEEEMIQGYIMQEDAAEYTTNCSINVENHVFKDVAYCGLKGLQT